MNQLSTIKLKSGREYSVERGHPWIFSGAVESLPKNIAEGDLVQVQSSTGNILGHGHYGTETIAVKVFSLGPQKIDSDFWIMKLEQAVALRSQLGLFDSQDTTAFRLVHAEGDGLPGLIIDWYAGTAVMQFQSLGMFRLKEELCEALQSALQGKLKAIYLTMTNLEAVDPAQLGYALGEPGGPVEILENGRKFNVDFASGQKTGFFTDQRDNRLEVSRYAKNKKVLDVCCYTGAFGVHALTAGASQVNFVDASSEALERTKENIHLNCSNANFEAIEADCFKFLQDTDQFYDLVIVDPPAFAKTHKAIKGGVAGYRGLNALAFQRITSGGFLATFSCSQHISIEMLRTIVIESAHKSGRKAQFLRAFFQAPCHPVNLNHPEGLYLKGFLIAVR